jgi:guanylate kinase
MDRDPVFPIAPAPSAPLLIVISAPSGGGKTTLCQLLLQACPDLERAVTCTTRPPRTGESDGTDYHFLAAAAFQQQVAAGEFLEHATVHGNRYGTRKSEVLDRLARGRDVLLNIDVQGAAAVRAQAAANPVLQAALVSVFLTPPSLRILEKRLRGRGTDAEEVIQRRLAAARSELEHWREFDYVILSASPEEDLRRAQAILAAEKLRSGRFGAGTTRERIEE